MESAIISGYDGKYTIFSNGTVQRNPSKFRRKTMFLKPKKDNYYRVTFWNKEGHKTFSVHRLVAIYFIPNSNNLPWVNHIDGNTYNNDISNLEWCTPTENEIHSIKILGADRNTEKQRKSAILVGKSKRKLTMKQADEIRNFANSTPRKCLATSYNVSLSVIDTIVQGKRYNDELTVTEL